MRTDDVRRDGSGIEDRRGGRRSGGAMFGAGGGMPRGFPMGTGGKIGIPGLIIMAVVFFLSQSGGDGGDTSTEQATGTPQECVEVCDFAADVRHLLTEFWADEFAADGEAFEPAVLVFFDSPTQTGGCGVGTPEAGPFYCPADSKMYIDLGFYRKLEDQLGFDGDFAMAYVLAHEYGHHVQNLIGVNEEVRRRTGGRPDSGPDSLSVKVELQADCLAGVWAHDAQAEGRLEAGDFEEALDAAEAVGDDAIAGSNANQESFTHGTSEQRHRWFRTGYDSGDMERCDTFA